MKKANLRLALMVVIVSCLFAGPNLSGRVLAFGLPDTDQRKCYQAASPYDEITCPAPGDPLAQDGSYVTNPLSYTNNGNGTVSDNNTGLMWQRQDDGVGRNWADASAYCDGLVLGGHSDWRLPSKKELITIVDYAIPYPGPAIRSVFTNTKGSDYWTATVSGGDPNVVWYLTFSIGSADYHAKSASKYVRCVRGTQQQQQFVDMGNGTVTELRTGLLWQQGEPGGMTWGEALAYCENLSLGGVNKWRLPNIKELESIYDDIDLIDPNAFPDGHPDSYWSSTSRASGPEAAWTLFFGGSGIADREWKHSNFYVRCVHAGLPAGPGQVAAKPSYGPHVGSPFVLETAFIRNGAPAVTSCEYTIDGSHRSPATVSGADPIFLCTKTGVTGTNGQVLTLNMRATSSAGILTAKAIRRRVDSAPPVSGAAFSATPGRGQCVLRWGAASDGGSGMHGNEAYEVRYLAGADPGSCVDGNLEYMGTELRSFHKGLLSGRTYYYRLCYKDNLGNSSEFTGNPVTCNPTSNASGPFKLPDAGQAVCYNENGVAIACPAPDQALAQDGSYHIPLSYTDNGNGTVMDNNTGLVWQKQDSGSRYNWYEASGTYNRAYNPSSTDVCGGLVLGGYSDWRLPSKLEMMSLVDYGIANPGPKINATYFPNPKSGYLTITTFAGNPDQAWGVAFNSGGVGVSDKILEGYVLCVRGQQLDFGRFTDNLDGTVTDGKNGLMWQQGEPGRGTWAQAIAYCEGLGLGGHSDWRLPNFKEIQSLTDDHAMYPAINTTYFPYAYGASWIDSYWSSTTYDYSKGGAFVADFHDGSCLGGGKLGGFNVRCVRGGPDPFIKAPSDLTADAVSPTRIDLGWKDNSGNETGFTLQRKRGDCSATTAWVDLSRAIGAGSVRLTVTVPAPNATYSYRIRAYNGGGYSAFSNCASAQTGP